MSLTINPNYSKTNYNPSFGTQLYLAKGQNLIEYSEAALRQAFSSVPEARMDEFVSSVKALKYFVQNDLKPNRILSIQPDEDKGIRLILSGDTGYLVGGFQDYEPVFQIESVGKRLIHRFMCMVAGVVSST
ncbi:MAG: hypothetical protein PHC64_04390 [Candidatus Gastranaerophilales bacterium]|nr:hypothetical protein [Candidatus Gastranaerophilales bacterium]